MAGQPQPLEHSAPRHRNLVELDPNRVGDRVHHRRRAGDGGDLGDALRTERAGGFVVLDDDRDDFWNAARVGDERN